MTVREALAALVAKLDEVHAHPAYQTVWSLAHVHGVEYRGPKYDKELEAAKAALAAPPPQIHSCDDPLCAGCNPVTAYTYAAYGNFED